MGHISLNYQIEITKALLDEFVLLEEMNYPFQGFEHLSEVVSTITDSFPFNISKIGNPSPYIWMGRAAYTLALVIDQEIDFNRAVKECIECFESAFGHLIDEQYKTEKVLIPLAKTAKEKV